MAGCGSCSSLYGGRRRRTRKSHRRRRHRGGNALQEMVSHGMKALGIGAHKAADATEAVAHQTQRVVSGGRKRRRTRRRTHYRHPKKGQRSRTRKGRLDFTTKKSSRVFNRRRHYQRRSSKGVKRRPFRTRRRR